MSSAARYHPRAPRYVFRASDHCLMRYAGMDTKGRSSRASIRDLSASGLSFVMSPGHAPTEGDVLKVEFALPFGQGASSSLPKQVAWFATVVRVESRLEWQPERGEQIATIIALRFRQLPRRITQAIHRSLHGQTSEANGETDLEVSNSSAADQAIFWTLAIVLILAMVLMALPAAVWLKPLHSLFS